MLTAQIRVPDWLLQLERNMRRSCNRRSREAKSKHTADCKVAAIYSSTLLAANVLQKVKEVASRSNDSSDDSSEDDFEEPESENEPESARRRVIVHTREEEDEESKSDNKPEPARSKVTLPVASEVESSMDSSSDESSKQGETKIRGRPPPKFGLPKPVARPYICPFKIEPTEERDIRLEGPFVDAVPRKMRGIESQPASVDSPQGTPPKLVERLDRRDGKHDLKMTREQYLKMREKLAGSRQSTHTKKRSRQAADESSILDGAQEFLNSPTRWHEEHRLQPKTDTPLVTKRPKLSSIPPARAEAKFSSSIKRNVEHWVEHNLEKSISSATSEPVRPSHRYDPKGFAQPEPTVPASQRNLKINAPKLRSEPKALRDEHNNNSAAETSRADPTTFSGKRYVKADVDAACTESDANSPSAFAVIKAPQARSEASGAVLSGSEATNVDAAPEANSSPPTPLDRALDRMLATHSRIAEGRVERHTKQRIVGLSRQSGGGLLQSLAPGSKGSVGRYGKDRTRFGSSSAG